MLEVTRTSQFKRDVKLAQKRGKNLNKLKKIMTLIVHEEPLDPKHREHRLTGNYRQHLECHIEPDWLLIYRVTYKEVIFERTGSHSDLFK